MEYLTCLFMLFWSRVSIREYLTWTGAGSVLGSILPGLEQGQY